MDICHLRNAELEAKHQKYKGRGVLRGDIVKDKSGSYAVFTEQGSSASQMTAAKIMDITSRLPGCDGQAADAVSAYTPVEMEDAHKLFLVKKQNRSVQTFGFVYHDTNGQNHGPVWKTQLFLLNGICTCIANIIRCLWCFTLLMNLHDFVAEPVNLEHIFHDAHTVPFCLTADHIATCHMFLCSHQVSTVLVCLWTRVVWKTFGTGDDGIWSHSWSPTRRVET